MLNPYIAQHYGSSMDWVNAGRGEDNDDVEVDAAVGFRRFPNATHMTHTVFRPKNAPAANSSPTPNASGNAPAKAVDTSDVLAALRLHRGLRIDNFPSRPVTPRGNTSQLPPLLPTDRSSAGSSDSTRDRGAGLLRNWVKPSSVDSSSASPPSPPSHAAEKPPAETEEAVAPTTGEDGHAIASHSPARAESQAGPPAEAPETSRGGSPVSSTKENGTRRKSRASPPPLPITAAAAFAKPVPSAEPAFPSVTVSPESPQLGSNAKNTPINQTPTPEPAHSDSAMDAMLLRSRAALEHVQRVLGETAKNVGGPAGAETAERPLAPPPPLSLQATGGADERPAAAASAALPAVTVVNTTAAATADDAPLPSGTASPPHSQEDSLDYVSPLSVNHNDVRGFPSYGRGVDGRRAPPLSVAVRADASAVPSESRYMVLCTVHDAAAVVAQRLRRRGPHAQAAETVVEAAGVERAAPHTRGAAATSPSRARRLPSSSRPIDAAVAERRRTSASAASSLHGEPTASPSRLASTSVPGSTAAVSQPPPSPPFSPSPAVAPPAADTHEDPSLLQELADFLRGGNASGFSSLSAALAAPPPPPPAAAAVAARSPRRSQAQVAPPPVVLVGNPLAARDSVVLQRSFTPSWQLARVGPQAEVPANVSPRRSSMRSRRVSSLPSYAQPTISWLSKGSEASADDFPVTHTSPPSSSLVREEGTQ